MGTIKSIRSRFPDMKGTYKKKQVNLSLLFILKDVSWVWKPLQLQSIMTQKSGEISLLWKHELKFKNKFVIMNGIKFIIENKKLNSMNKGMHTKYLMEID